MMVVARDRFLGRGHYQPVAASVRSLAAQCDQREHGLVVDLAGGTGYYLAKILDALPHRHGVCLDLSAPALRRAAGHIPARRPSARTSGSTSRWQPIRRPSC